MRLNLSAIDDKRLSFMLDYWERLSESSPPAEASRPDFTNSHHGRASHIAPVISAPHRLGHYADISRGSRHPGRHAFAGHEALRHPGGHLDSPRFVPSRRAIDPIAIPRNILPHLFLADVRDERPHYQLRLTGTALEDRFGICRGAALEALHLGSESETVRSQCDAVLDEARPVYCVHDFEDDRRRPWRYRRLLMPLSTEKQSIDGLFGVVVFSPRAV